MSTDELEREQPGAAVSVGEEPEAEAGEAGAEEPKRKLEIAVAISEAGPCKKHLKVTIPRSEIDRQFHESLETLRKDAVVPGFRPGRAPRQLVVKRFKKQVSDQVKSSLLVSSLEQIDKDYQLDPITQPQLDVAAIELPEDGPMSFEMDVEVRPQFDVPNYKGLALRRPIRAITEADIETQLRRYLERHGQVVPKLEGAAELGDYLTADLVFYRPDGSVLNEAKETQFRLQAELRFRDGAIANLGAVLTGVRPGETRRVEARLGSAASEPALRGATIPVQVRVHDLKQLRLPELNQAFLDSIEFDSLDQLREAVHDALKRRLQAQQFQVLRQQILDELLRQTPFELPTDLVSREEANTIRRLVLELRQEGFSDEEIRAREAQIRANAHESTLRSLQEFLLLAKIADAEGIQVADEDVALEIEAIAERSGESPRRVRARLEKERTGDHLATQILERKVLERILQQSTIEDVVVATDEPEGRVETLDQSAAAAAEEPPPAEETADVAGDRENPS
jgi:trigger factor